MSSRSLFERTAQAAILPAIVVTTTNSPANGVDMTAFNALMFVANIGLSADTLSGSIYYELEIQHSVDDSTWVAATDDMIEDPVTGTTTGTFAKIILAGDSQSYVGGVKRPTEFKFWRVIVRSTGTHTNGTPISIDAIKGAAQILPAS